MWSDQRQHRMVKGGVLQAEVQGRLHPKLRQRSFLFRVLPPSHRLRCVRL